MSDAATVSQQLFLLVAGGLGTAVLGLAGYVVKLQQMNAKKEHDHVTQIEAIQDKRIDDMKAFNSASAELLRESTQTIESTKGLMQDIRNLLQSLWRRQTPNGTRIPQSGHND